MFWYSVSKNREEYALGRTIIGGTCNREELESIAYDARMSGWVMAFGPVVEPVPHAKELSPEMAGL